MLEHRIEVVGLLLEVDADGVAFLDVGELGRVDHGGRAPVAEHGLRVEQDGALRNDGRSQRDERHTGHGKADALETQTLLLQLVDGLGGNGGLEVIVTVHTREDTPVAPIFDVLEHRVEFACLFLEVDTDDVTLLDIGELLGRDGDGRAPVGEGRLLGPDDIAFHVDGRVATGRVATTAATARGGTAFLEEQAHQGVALTGKEQVLGVEQIEKRRCAGQVDDEDPSAVFIVDEQVVAGFDVIRQVGLPPAVRDADLRAGALDQRIERLGLDPIPDLLRERGVALVVAVVAVQAEAVVQVAPAGRAIHGFVLPEDVPLGTFVAAAIDPDLFPDEDADRGVAGAREEQVLFLERGDQVGFAGKVDRHGAGAVLVFGHEFAAPAQVALRPFDTPVAVGHPEVGVRALDVHIERLGQQLVPNGRRERGDALAEAVVALQAEAVLAGPGHLAGARILPQVLLDRLPVAAIGRLPVREFRQEELLAVKGEDLARPGPFEDLSRDGDDDRTRALAVEEFVLDDQRIAVRVEQFGPADELQVLAVDGQLLAAFDLLAVRLGVARDNGVSEGDRNFVLRLLVGRADDQLAAAGGDARRGGHPDHPVADMLDGADGDAVGEDDLPDVAEAGAAQGHRLAGDHLGRKHRLDGQGPGIRVFDFLGVAGREHAREGDGQNQTEMGNYLFHA